MARTLHVLSLRRLISATLVFFVGTVLSEFYVKTRFDRSVDKQLSYSDFDTGFIAYKDSKLNVCYLERLKYGLYESDLWREILQRMSRIRTLYVSDESLTKLEGWRLAGGRIVFFCQGSTMILLRETPSIVETSKDPFYNEIPEDENDIVPKRVADVILTPLLSRAKRQIQLEQRELTNPHKHDRVERVRRQSPYRARFRGQTQSQYLNSAGGKSQGGEGKAEAEATHESSRAVVVGSSGMGQAQSMSGGGAGCEGCPGYSGSLGGLPDTVPGRLTQIDSGVTRGGSVGPGPHGAQSGRFFDGRSGSDSRTASGGTGGYPVSTEGGTQLQTGPYPRGGAGAPAGSYLGGEGGRVPGSSYPGAPQVSTGRWYPGGAGIPGGSYPGEGGTGIPGGSYPGRGTGVPGTSYPGPVAGVPGSPYPGPATGATGGSYPGSGVGIPGSSYPGAGAGAPGSSYPGPAAGAPGSFYPGPAAGVPGSSIPGGSYHDQGTGAPGSSYPGRGVGVPGSSYPEQGRGVGGSLYPGPGAAAPGSSYPGPAAGAPGSSYPGPAAGPPGSSYPGPAAGPPGSSYPGPAAGPPGSSYPGPAAGSPGSSIPGGAYPGTATGVPGPNIPGISYPEIATGVPGGFYPGSGISDGRIPGGPYPGTVSSDSAARSAAGTRGGTTGGPAYPGPSGQYPQGIVPGAGPGGPYPNVPSGPGGTGSYPAVPGPYPYQIGPPGGSSYPGSGTYDGGRSAVPGTGGPGGFPGTIQPLPGTSTGLEGTGGSTTNAISGDIYSSRRGIGGYPAGPLGGFNGRNGGSTITGEGYPGGSADIRTAVTGPGGLYPTGASGPSVTGVQTTEGGHIPGANAGYPAGGPIAGVDYNHQVFNGGTGGVGGPQQYTPLGGGTGYDRSGDRGTVASGAGGGSGAGADNRYIPGVGYPTTSTGINYGYPGTQGSISATGAGLPIQQYPGDGSYGETTGGVGSEQQQPGSGGLQSGYGGSLDDGADSQASSSVKQTEEGGTQASANSLGKYGQGVAKSQVSGTYSGSGSFSAQAGTTDDKKSAQTQVSGGREGATSNAESSGGLGKSQTQVQLDSESGMTSTGAQSSGWNHGTNSQVQASSKGGMADAQANGEGSTSSQAQIGFKPYTARDDEKVEKRTSPFKGGGTASAQSGTYRGQSQSQLHGSFQYSISYNGAAQAGSGSGAAASRKPFKFDNHASTDLFKPFPFPKSQTDAPPASKDVVNSDNIDSSENVEVSEFTTIPPDQFLPLKPEIDHPTIQANSIKNTGLQTAGSHYASQALPNGAPFPTPTSMHEITEKVQVESTAAPKSGLTEDDPVYDNTPNEDYGESYSDTPEEDYDASSDRQHAPTSEPRISSISADRYNAYAPREGDILQPGQSLPGYTVPPGFRGRVVSTPDADGAESKTNATKAVEEKSEKERPETKALRTSHERNYNNYGSSRNTMSTRQYMYQPSVSRSRPVSNGYLRSVSPSVKPNYYTVTNSVAGKVGGGKNEPRKYEHRYYTKSSTCGYFTFSCDIVHGSNGRTKICKPKIPTNPDGTPMQC